MLARTRCSPTPAAPSAAVIPLTLSFATRAGATCTSLRSWPTPGFRAHVGGARYTLYVHLAVALYNGIDVALVGHYEDRDAREHVGCVVHFSLDLNQKKQYQAGSLVSGVRTVSGGTRTVSCALNLPDEPLRAGHRPSAGHRPGGVLTSACARDQPGGVAVELRLLRVPDLRGSPGEQVTMTRR
jgi:hypothetical protein